MKTVREIFSFLMPNVAGQSVHMAMFLSAVALAVALLGVPMLDRAAQVYADNKAFGIDQVITSSVDRTKRYTVRKSVLDDDQNN